MTSPAELQANNFLRMGKCAVSERPMGEVYLLESEVLPVVQAQSDEVRRLREALDAAQTNASRYEWLRDHWDEPEVQKLHPWDEFSPDPDQLDEQIDAALGSQP